MATVQLPNGDTMEVPDNFTADQVKAAAAKYLGAGNRRHPSRRNPAPQRIVKRR